MQYRKLGRTNVDVSAICLGTMTWGKQNSEAQGHEQMNYALDQGVNFWDTAEMYAIPPTAETYGKTEEIIGTWFAENQSKRGDVILASKIAGSGLGWVRESGYKIDRKNILKAVDASLERLQTDYIDLYQLHWPNRGSYHFGQHWEYNPRFDKDEVEANFVEVLETLDELVKLGKLRHIGLSNETAWGTMKYLELAEKHDLPRMQSIQNEYSLLCRLFEEDLQEASLTENCGLLAWSPLASGMISGKYLNGARPEGTRWTLLDEESLSRNTDHANNAIRRYLDTAQRHGLDVCQMALAFVNQQPFVTSNIIGATTMDQLKTNIASIDVTLSEEVLEEIRHIYHDYPLPY